MKAPFRTEHARANEAADIARLIGVENSAMEHCYTALAGKLVGEIRARVSCLFDSVEIFNDDVKSATRELYAYYRAAEIAAGSSDRLREILGEEWFVQ